MVVFGCSLPLGMSWKETANPARMHGASQRAGGDYSRAVAGSALHKGITCWRDQDLILPELLSGTFIGGISAEGALDGLWEVWPEFGHCGRSTTTARYNKIQAKNPGQLGRYIKFVEFISPG